MVARRSAVAAVLIALTLGVGSASSLGSFPQVTLTAFSATVDPCAADAMAFEDDPLLGRILPVTRIDGFELTGITGDCGGARSTVVVDGLDGLGGRATRTFELTSLADPAPSSTTVLLDSAHRLDGFVVVASRVGFEPS